MPGIQIERLQGMFAAAGWRVLTLKWGRTDDLWPALRAAVLLDH